MKVRTLRKKNKSHHIFFFWHSGKLNRMLNYMKRMHIWETKLDLIGCPTLLFFLLRRLCSREHWSKKTYWSQVFFLSLAHIPPVPFFEDQGTIEKNASIQIILMEKKVVFASTYLINQS